MHNFFRNNLDTFTALLEHLNEGIIIHSDDTKILYANRAASKILGIEGDILLGKTAYDSAWYFVDENMDRLNVESYPVNKVFASNTNLNDELIGVHLPSGELRWIDINGTIVTDNHGNRTAMMVFSDVTDRKNAFDEAELFKKAIEAIDTGITISDGLQKDYPLVFANKAFYTLTGYSEDEVIGKNCRFMQGDLNDQEGRFALKKALKEFTSCKVEMTNFKKNGEPFNNLLTVSPISLHNRTTHFIGVQHDITYLKKQEEKLKEQTLYIQNILDAQDNIVILTDGKKIVFANKALLNFFGCDSLENFIEESTCICHRFIPDSHYFHLGKVSEDELWVNTLMRLPNDQKIVIMESSEAITHYFRAKVTHFNHQYYVVSFSDVSAALLKEEILTNKAYHDPLTGVLNRQFLYEFITKWVRQDVLESPLMGVVLLDIDNFKTINDTYGHLQGDEVLQILAKTLTKTLRSKDSVFRWGGEEFVIVLHVQQPDQLFNIAEKMRTVIEQTTIEGVGTITCSFGITMMHQKETLESALERADEALYRAKKSGKNRVESNFIANTTH
jgi:diguanylate cyclase (GGDEF)-like protein/PAS domain S-box-containing protein